MPDTVKFVLFSAVPIIQDVFLILLFIRGMVLCKNRKDTQYDRLVSLSPVLLWVGAVCGGMLSVPVTLFGADDIPSGVWYIFEVVVLACIAMMLAYCNETVTYDESRFEKSNLFGIKHSYDYGEITGISRKGGDTILRCGRRRIRLDTMTLGSSEFVAHADKAYIMRHKKHLPVYKSKKDPMNGNLDTPWLYLFISGFTLIASIGMIILPGFVLRPADDCGRDEGGRHLPLRGRERHGMRERSGHPLLRGAGREGPPRERDRHPHHSRRRERQRHGLGLRPDL